MKISKLFHWLYAILMFLPIMVFIPNAFYYGFNEHAVAQEKTEQVPIYYESNEVNDINDVIQGNVYRIYVEDLINYSSNINESFILCEKLWITGTSIYFNNVISQQTPFIHLVYTQNNNSLLYAVNTTKYKLTEGYIDFVYKTTLINNYYNFFKVCNENYIKEYQPLTTNMSITDSMSYAWDSVWQNELFSWTNNTFLNEPFVYITDLFGIPSDNELINALSYWLDISIIWLVFDVIMYVPLLTHRWLDKGIVE